MLARRRRKASAEPSTLTVLTGKAKVKALLDAGITM
jgi:hypothetical protein